MTDDDRTRREPSRQAPSAFLRGRTPQAERVGTHRGHDARTAYRHMRWAWWTLTAAFVASLLFDASVELRLGLFVFWGALGAAAAHWPCPHCGGRVGVAGKFFVLRVPFGGWCLSCHQRLFGRRASRDD